jgi:hypothetical protein
VVEDDTEVLVVLVSCELKFGEPFSANFSSSKTSRWSILDSGLVCGGEKKLIAGDGPIPNVYYFTKKALFDLRGDMPLLQGWKTL